MKRIYLLLAACSIMNAARPQALPDIVKGNQNYKQGQLDAAEFYYRRSLEAEPNNITVKYNLACVLHKKGKNPSETAALLKQVYESAKDPALKAKAYYNEGVSNSKYKNLPASIESYKHALRIDPNDKQARENLQKALLELKKQQQKTSPKKSDPKMSQKEAEQKLRQLQQREKELQKRMQGRNNQGTGQAQDW
ncbi:MAG TPA: hypothetical protein VFR58_17955 [Flavisolibacter sp.]|nr:hypothetical protein [Flavisolibacter sp.]